MIPFRAAIAAGVQGGDVGPHRDARSLARARRCPATLAPEILTGILRDSLRFDGLVVTDALNMGALVNTYGPGESAVKAFVAGSDLLLMPTDPRSAIDAMVEAVGSGRISRSRLDASLRRMLEIKARLGLFRRRTVNLDSLPTPSGRRAHRDTALAVSGRALVLVRDSLGILDSLRAGPRALTVVTYADAGSAAVGGHAHRGADPARAPGLLVSALGGQRARRATTRPRRWSPRPAWRSSRRRSGSSRGEAPSDYPIPWCG